MNERYADEETTVKLSMDCSIKSPSPNPRDASTRTKLGNFRDESTQGAYPQWFVLKDKERSKRVWFKSPKKILHTIRTP